LISALDVLGFVEGGRGVNVECFSEFAVTFGARAEVCAGEIFETARGLRRSCETGYFLFVETTVTTGCYAGLTGGGLVACGGRVTSISVKIERGRYHLSWQACPQDFRGFPHFSAHFAPSVVCRWLTCKLYTFSGEHTK